MKKSFKFLLFVLVFSIIISIPLLIPYIHSGYFPTHDGEWAVVRLSDMFREIRDLQIPPRYSGNLNFSYGYPLFNFAYPFPYYIGVLIHMLGFGFVDTIKIIFGASVPLSAFFMFLASRNIWKNDYAGVISSVLYLYFPYRLVDLYVRGSIGESVAFVFFPLILLCLSKLIDSPSSMGFKLLGGAAFACLVLTHNIMAVLFSISLLIFFVGNVILRKQKTFWNFLFVFILGFVLSAFFWIPALLEKNWIILSQIPIADRSLYFVTFSDLLLSPWGYGIPTDRINGFTYQIGWPFILALLSVSSLLLINLYKKVKANSDQILALVLLVGTLVFSILLFSFSAPVWKIPLLSEINYPWTILSQLGLLISLLAGYLIKYKLTLYLAIGITIFAIFLYLPLAKPSEYIDKGDGHYFTNDATTTSSNELMPLWVKRQPSKRPAEKVQIIKGEGVIENIFYNSKEISFSANLLDESTIRINTIYYPGWKLFVNNSEKPITYNNDFGLMEIKINKGTSNISGNFSETNLRLIADLISIIGLIFVAIMFARTYLLNFIKNANS